MQQEDLLADIHTRQCAITLLLAHADARNITYINALIHDAKEVSEAWEKQQKP